MSMFTVDVLIIGAGPVGLFSVFELGLLDIQAHIIDTLDKPGGQCAQLYPEKPIYDIPGLPIITAQGLVDNLLEQIRPFNPTFHMGQTVMKLEQVAAGLFRVTTLEGIVFETRVLVIATGGGHFEPKKPPLPQIDLFEGKSVFYAVKRREAFAGKHVVIAGGGDTSLDWALNLFPLVKRLSMVHRREEFRGQPHSANQIRELIAKGEIDFHMGQLQSIHGEDGIMTHLKVAMNDGTQKSIEADVLLPFFGLTMKSTPLTQFGFEMNGPLICVNTADFETSIPGIFAIGDINTYPGKLKLILSGFHEGALMAQKAAHILHPDKKQVFQYTTSSPLLQKRLGVRA